MPHGTVSRYTNDGCRCGRCRKAGSAAHLAWSKRPHDPGLMRHGEPVTYKSWGCRCDLCRAANRLAAAGYRARQRQLTTGRT